MHIFHFWGYKMSIFYKIPCQFIGTSNNSFYGTYQNWEPPEKCFYLGDWNKNLDFMYFDLNKKIFFSKFREGCFKFKDTEKNMPQSVLLKNILIYCESIIELSFYGQEEDEFLCDKIRTELTENVQDYELGIEELEKDYIIFQHSFHNFSDFDIYVGGSFNIVFQEISDAQPQHFLKAKDQADRIYECSTIGIKDDYYIEFVNSKTADLPSFEKCDIDCLDLLNKTEINSDHEFLYIRNKDLILPKNSIEKLYE